MAARASKEQFEFAAAGIGAPDTVLPQPPTPDPDDEPLEAIIKKKKAPKKSPAEKGAKKAPAEKAPKKAPAEKAPKKAPTKKAPKKAPTKEAAPARAPDAATAAAAAAAVTYTAEEADKTMARSDETMSTATDLLANAGIGAALLAAAGFTAEGSLIPTTSKRQRRPTKR